MQYCAQAERVVRGSEAGEADTAGFDGMGEMIRFGENLPPTLI